MPNAPAQHWFFLLVNLLELVQLSIGYGYMLANIELAKFGGENSPPSPTPTQFFLKSLFISNCQIVHLVNICTTFSCGFHFCSDLTYNVWEFCIYRHWNYWVTYFVYNSNFNYFFEKSCWFLIRDNVLYYLIKKYIIGCFNKCPPTCKASRCIYFIKWSTV